MEYIPNIQNGYLPLFVLFVGVTAIGNAVSCYTDTSYLKRVYNPPFPAHHVSLKTTEITRTIEIDYVTAPEARRPSVTTIATAMTPQSAVTDLSSRTFATWNLAVGIVRVIAAYHMEDRSWYLMSIYTNLIGLAHFGAEAFVWKTARPSGPWLAPTSVATVGLLWHMLQFGNYVK